MKFNVTDQHVTTDLEYDQLVISGDESEGFRPFQLMMSSLAGCSVLVYKRILQKQKIEYDEMTVEAEVQRSDDAVNKIEKVNLHFKVTGHNLNEEKLQKSLNTASKNCSMVQSVVPTIEVEETVEAINKE
ncbi:OsmC family protein [Alkalibacillus haloalkaliphilus]|uniref:Osmotically inducible protein C n=1 Tax=Alkalibacillus haloalkaliphilus TaxID=94136 RepID=A0A511W9R6_9BACI|nr:OsmC family protein [Alkalibacillus haloalkaliphilus]GEN46823.1 osmotically inducible protein C [Alkalibacillus haloalkaliphilus]